MNKYMKYSVLLLIASSFVFLSCGGKTERRRAVSDTIALMPCPNFVADSAKLFIQKQCSFGPRVPGSGSSEACGDYIADEFRRFGATVTEQRIEVIAYDGKRLPARNITASVNPECAERILFCAHWDSRPWADNDPDPKNHHTPVPAANDGASGVAVMMELCRQIQQKPVKIGVDFVCFDAEDMGTPDWAENADERSDTWCLGSREWAREARARGYRARYGVLLDMVGGRGTTFSREGVSRQYADPVVEMIWRLAHQLGYGHYFPLKDGGSLIDDHVNVNRIARIPCVDIVPYVEYGPSSFGPTWHTLSDTPENIDPNVLEAVGQTLVQLLYNEEIE